VGDIGGHTYGHPLTLRDLDEQLGGAALKVAAEDVAEECVAGKESGPAANGDALGRAGPGQDDDLGHAGRCQDSIANMSSVASSLRINLTAMCPPSAGTSYLSPSNPFTRMPASKMT